MCVGVDGGGWGWGEGRGMLGMLGTIPSLIRHFANSNGVCSIENVHFTNPKL